MQQFQPGDQVTPKSGSQRMVVIAAGRTAGSVVCEWRDGKGNRIKQEFSEVALKPYEPEEEEGDDE